MALSQRAFITKVLEATLDAVERGSVASLENELLALADAPLAPSTSTPRDATICKVDPEQRMVYGWAKMATVDGEPVIDLQDDEISVDELRDTAHDFVKSRVLGVMHSNTENIGDLRESIVFSKALQDALGIDLGVEGWFVGVHVNDDATWARVQKGELRAFSIGGSGIRDVIKADLPRARGRTALAKVALFSEALDAFRNVGAI